MNHNLDLLLVNPCARKRVYEELSEDLQGLEPPLWCALTASYFREGYGMKVKILDAEVENLSPEETVKKIVELDPNIVNIIIQGNNPSASSTPKMPLIKPLMKGIREETDAWITLGGLHVSALPEQTFWDEKVDGVYVGEPYKDLDLPVADLSKLPLPAWDLLPMEKYRCHNWHAFNNDLVRQPYGISFTSMGCPYGCTVCNIHSQYLGVGKPSIRYRPIPKIIEELDLLHDKYKVRQLKFMDEIFAINEKRVVEVCDAIIERNYDFNIWAYARVDTITPLVAKKMKQAGINWACLGIESVSDEIRGGVNKNFRQSTEKAIEILRKEDLLVLGNFIFGLPDDTMETMRANLDFAKKHLFEYVAMYTCFAYPGSPLYNEALEKGWELPEEWSGYGQYSYDCHPLPTKYLTSRQVLEFRDKAFVEYFSNPDYLEMVEKKFGNGVTQHIEEMLKHKLRRKLLGD